MNSSCYTVFTSYLCAEDYIIDMQIGFNNTPRIKDRKRTVANENDVLGLLWLTKLKIK